MSRRAFMGTAGGAGAVAFLGLWDTRLLFAEPIAGAKAKSVILLWMAGGQSHIDTWDPKPGVDTGGPFEAIETAVDGIRISEHLPKIGRQFKDISLVRSLTAKEGNHDRATYQMHTGYVPLGSFQHATLGSVAAKELSEADPEIPAYISINGRKWSAGHLGAAYGPFHIGDATEPAENLTYHHSVDEERFRNRLALLKRLDKNFAGKYSDEEVIQAYAHHYESAHRLMKSKAAQAFDLNREKGGIREAYGMSQFGQGCLLARRLAQQGVRFIEVTLGGWDTHDDNFVRVKDNSATMDQAVAALIADLRAKNMLDSTLVLLCSEFGRTPKIKLNKGRDHWPRVWSAMLAGGGIEGGRVVGASTDDGAEVRDRPVQIDELHATVCHLMGIDASKRHYAADGRPIRVIQRKDAKPITDLVA